MEYFLKVSHSTLERLDGLRVGDDDCYDMIINRLLDVKLGTMLIGYFIVDLCTGVELGCRVDYDCVYPNLVYVYDNIVYASLDELSCGVDDVLLWVVISKLGLLDLFEWLPCLDPYEFVFVDGFLLIRGGF